PATSLTYYEALEFCNWLSEKEGIPEDQWCYPRKIGPGMKPHPDYLRRTGYRLPSESEWEHACRSGSEERGHYGSDPALLARYGHFSGNSSYRAWPVGQKRPNDLGLFDAEGNVSTWCGEQVRAYPSGRRPGTSSTWKT